MKANVLMTRQRLFDGVAIGASALCLVHCLVLPAILVLAPTLALFLAIPEGFHTALLLVAMPTSAAALWIGHKRNGRLLPAALAIVGLTFLAAGLMVPRNEQVETALTVVGSVLLASGHALNWRALRHTRAGPRA